MFDNLFIVSTAISAFNNNALVGPFFFAVGLLMIPMFLMVYVYGKDFVNKFGWNDKNIDNQSGLWIISSLVLWLFLFGGNYAVIRDGISLLPLILSAVLFGCIMFISQKILQLKYNEKIQNKKLQFYIFMAILLMAGFSAFPIWYAILLQISAVLCGMIIGSRMKKNISIIPFTTLICGIMLILVLMQPEYFRFGQFDNLTIVHVLSIIITGFLASVVLSTKYIKPRGRIHESAYIKLKWLCRIVSILGFVLFFMTESVPVFIGLLGALMVSEMLTIFHVKDINSSMYKQAWAYFMICFGIVLICPIISAIGIIYLSFMNKNTNIKDFLRLL
ncbi:MAG: hypothetical protein IKZ49_03130 [Alphaproteobacteria bacterium]|nr:hypothetical protein [Alphaproteobacteria bacterium]